MEIVKDVMGSPGQLQYGLVDAADEDQLDSTLSKFSSRWNTLEEPYNSPPSFHTWFVKHCCCVVAQFMLRSVREKAGLGSPPTPYYTNEVESKNRVLKEEVLYKSCQLPDFIQKMKSVFEQQKAEIERAVVNTGEYRLRAEYQHLSVESSKWFKLSNEQRRRKIEKFMKAPLAEDAPSTSGSGTMDSCGGLEDVPIPAHLKLPMWDKANKLASDDSAIVKAPGAEDGWMVVSSSCKRPHYIKASKCAFSCDDQCLSYKSMKLCSHTVAVAIKTDSLRILLKRYRSLKCSPNFTALAEAGKPKSTGKKPMRKLCQRSALGSKAHF